MLKLDYNQGTIVLSGITSEDKSSLPPGFLWDKRTNNFRAPAYLYRRTISYFNDKPIEFSGTVFEKNDSHSSLAWRDIALYPYQSSAAALWEAEGKKGIIVLPTGAGKTRVALSAIKAQCISTLIIVPTRALLQQWLKGLQELYTGEIGIIGDGEYFIKSITIATFESAYRHIKKLGNQFQMLVIDEAHHFGCGIRDEILIMAASPFRLALTASLPTDELHLKKMTSLIGPVIFQKSIKDLKGDYLSDFEHTTLKVSLTPAEHAEYKASYDIYLSFVQDTKHCWQALGWQAFTKHASHSPIGRKAMRAASQARGIVNGCSNKMNLLHRLLQKHWQDQIFIFAASTRDVYNIAKRGWAYPITSSIKKNERELVLKQFARGSIRAIAACKVLNEGIDVPAASVAIIIGGSGNTREQIQRIGRVLRKIPDKKAKIYEIIVQDTFEVKRSLKRNADLT